MLNITIAEYLHFWDAYVIVHYLSSAFKVAAVLFIGSYFNETPTPILISSHVPWIIHQPINGVWLELTPLPPLNL